MLISAFLQRFGKRIDDNLILFILPNCKSQSLESLKIFRDAMSLSLFYWNQNKQFLTIQNQT